LYSLRSRARSASTIKRTNSLNVTFGSHFSTRRALGWKPKVTFRKLVQLMVDADLALLRSEYNLE
jgi:GDP-D-mannose dehydratase